MKLILQTESSECGLACLAMILNHFHHPVELSELRRRFLTSSRGITLPQLIRHANTLELSARAVRVELDELTQLALPCILHWNLNHFVVLKSIKRNRKEFTLVVLDPSIGENKITSTVASKHFTGIALELSPSLRFEKTTKIPRLSIKTLIGPISGLTPAIIQIIALSFALEIFAIVSPLFNQFVIDEVIVTGDRELLKVIIIGFSLILITQNVISFARSWILMRWSMSIALQWSTRVLSHLLRLPVSYFEKRHLGDILSRFGSIAAIQDTLTGLFIESLLDGLMTILALSMMILYSGILTCIVVSAVALYALLRWVFYRPFREASRERLVLAAKENSHFLESMRAVVPLKLFGRESDRLARWQNLKIDVQNRDVRTQKLAILFKTGQTSIFGIQNLATFYVGANLIMGNVLTIGMLMAFSSYAATFLSRISSLVDLVIGLNMLKLHSDRLSDIVLEDDEKPDGRNIELSKICPNIFLSNIKFRYADGEPWILNGINLSIPAGQSVAIVGPSGCGKTTLCKILLGLLSPTEGQVLIDGVPIAQLGLQAYRRLVGTVMQDDALLAGSIFENISFFDTEASLEHVVHCATLAAIAEEINAMPMGFQTLVGDMGSSLSGGQKQRLLLARALYKNPVILALDEATSHLDVENEVKVNETLSKMKLTRVIVAHRPETIRSAGRVVRLSAGLMVDLDENDE